MSNKISIGELKNLIANSVKDKGLNDILSPEVLEVIQNKIARKIEMDKASSQIPTLIPEVDSPSPPTSGGPIEFPDEEQITADNINTNSEQAPATNTNMVPDSELEQPKIGYVVEMPAFLDKIEPGKVIVFDYNELSEGGENLANKPLRTYENPDMKKSIHDLWIEEGKRKAEVYIAKFEKIGELSFDYANGTAKFTEQRFESNPIPSTEVGYQENPYKNEVQPQLTDTGTAMNAFETYSADLQKLITETIASVLKEYTSKKENTIDTKKLDLKVSQLFDDKGNFEKKKSPQNLIEAVKKNVKECLVCENSEVQKYVIDGINYYLPKDPISLKNCFIEKTFNK